jgi:hypothetical protein
LATEKIVLQKIVELLLPIEIDHFLGFENAWNYE